MQMRPSADQCTAPPSSATCPARISPLERRRRCPFIHQVCLHTAFVITYKFMLLLIRDLVITGRNDVIICNNNVIMDVITKNVGDSPDCPQRFLLLHCYYVLLHYYYIIITSLLQFPWIAIRSIIRNNK